MADVNYGGMLAEKLTGFISLAGIMKFVMSIVVVILITGVGILLWKRMNWVTKALILEKRGTGGLIVTEDYIKRKKNQADGTYSYDLVKSREPIREITTDHLYPFGKNKNYVILVKGEDGYYHPTDVALDYRDSKGVTIPYIKPIDVDLRDWAFQKQTQKLEKYTIKTVWDKVSPFMTIAVTGIICVIMLHLTGKNIASMIP